MGSNWKMLIVASLLVSCSEAPPAQRSGHRGEALPNVNTPIGDNGLPSGDDQAPGEDSNEPEGIPVSCNIPAPVAPVIAQAPAGQMIRTVSGGRVRHRHESNGSFGSFGDQYFENRSFEFSIDDYTPTGDKRIVFTLKPLGIHGRGGAGDAGLPNFRIFQNGGTNPDLFNSNNTFKDNGDNIFTFEIKDGGNNPQTALTNGRLIGFEFGFFFNKDKVPGRNSYYSDTFRFQVGKSGMVLGVPMTDGVASNPEAMPPRSAWAGGEHTVPLIKAAEDQALHFSQSSLNISAKDMQGFLEGRSLFHSDFVEGKHSENGINFSPERIAKQKGLAGPAMDASACSKCHMHNGSFAIDEKARPDHVLKVHNLNGSVNTEFGLQIQKSELAKATQLKRTTLTKEVVYSDGTKVTLSAPQYAMTGSLISARVPQMVYGLGLLEAVSEENIASRVPCEGDDALVSGKMAEAVNPKTGKKALGRFGWKAGKVSLEHQVSEAALLDLGVTNPLYPSDSCEKTGTCTPGTPELPQEDIDRLVTYMRNIAVPVQRNIDDPRFADGKRTFNKLGCGSCHVGTLYTDDKHPVEKLRNQTFHPYTDLLLHDMGAGLADGKPEHNASAQEWRTPPLWGLGLMKTVNGQMLLLHDGRAKSFEEAILWHGGEAASMQAGFLNLPKTEREALLFFLESI